MVSIVRESDRWCPLILRPKSRLANFEALRILAFVMIVSDHVSWSGVTLIDTNDPNWYFSTFINIWSRFGVDLFVLIGAYFLSSRTLGVSDIAKRWWRILYPIAILLGVVYLISPPMSLQGVFEDLILLLRGSPVSIQGIWLGHLWFIFPYLILVAISPILNFAIDSMDRRTHRRVMFGLAGLFIIVPTINAIVATPLLYIAGGPILTFIALYFVASYIRKFDVRIAPLKGGMVTMAIIIAIFVLTFAYTLVFHIPTPENPNGTNTYFFGDSILPVFIGSIFLFLTFRSIDLKNKLISFSGKLTYDAFLIHSVVWFLVMIAWPVSYVEPYAGITTQIVVTILLVVSISFVYALSRHLMDLGLSRFWREIKNVASSKK